MRKIRLVPAAVLLLGLLGAFVRRVELRTAFDEAGLPRRGAAVSIALIMLTVLAVVIAVAVAVAARGYETGEGYRRAFPIRGYLTFAVMALIGIAVIVCAVLLIRADTELLGLTGMARWVFVGFLGLCGFGMTTMAYSAYTLRETSFLQLGSVMPALLYCYWMVACYRENAGNPVLLEYCYSCVAFAVGSLGFFYSAGFAFGRKSLTGTLAMNIVSIFLLPVAAADPAPLALKVPLILSAVYVTVNTVNLLSVLKVKEKTEN